VAHDAPHSARHERLAPAPQSSNSFDRCQRSNPNDLIRNTESLDPFVFAPIEHSQAHVHNAKESLAPISSERGALEHDNCAWRYIKIPLP
jgi:hypothetical protein